MKKRMIIGLSAFVVVLGALPSVYFYNRFQQAQRNLQNPTEYTKEEARLLNEKVGKLIELPKDEQPTIATVTDADKLRSQPFFASAQNGDRVLIYTGAKKAILYRPSTNKIIEVAPVNIGQNATPSALPSSLPASGQAGQASFGQISPTPRETGPTPTSSAQK